MLPKYRHIFKNKTIYHLLKVVTVEIDGWEAKTEEIQHDKNLCNELFTRTYATFGERHKRMLISIVKDPVTAEDLLQDAYLRAFEKLGQFNGEAAFGTWLYTIARNTAFDYQRKQKVRHAKRHVPIGSNSEETDTLDVPDPDNFAQRIEDQDHAAALLKGINKRDAQLFFERTYEGRSIDEIAERTGINPNTIKVRLFRARQLMAKGVPNGKRFQYMQDDTPTVPHDAYVMLAALPEEQQSSVFLGYCLRIPSDDAAHILGIPPYQHKQHYQEGLRTIDDILEGKREWHASSQAIKRTYENLRHINPECIESKI